MAYTSDTKECAVCGKERKIEKSRTACYSCRLMISKAKRHDGVLPPDYKHTTVAKYKEPMEKVEGGHGYFGAVTESKDGNFLQCHICGYFFENLSSHIQKHGISHKQYKTQFGLRISDGLVGKRVRANFQDSFNQLVRATGATKSEFGKQASIKARVAVEKAGYKPGGNMWRAITRNERGNCRAQTLVKIQSLAAENGGFINAEMFYRAYGTGQKSVIKTHFGNFDAALKEASIDTRHQQRLTRHQLSEERAIKQLKAYYKKHGRTPQWADLLGKRTAETKLPSVNYIKDHFRTINNYRYLAGVPLLVNTGNGVWAEVHPESDEYKDYQVTI